MMDRNHMKEALKQCERKLLGALKDSPLVLTLTSAADYRYIEVNDTFERLTGWKRNEVIGRTPFDLNLWVDPGERINLVKQLLSGGDVRNVEFRVRMKNGELKTARGSAALIEIDGETCVLSMAADMTDLKPGRLIQSQEEERASIARLLHDYVDRLMLISADLDQLQRTKPRPSPETSEKAEQARDDIEALVLDIQALSHTLHSTELEYLGLEAAAASLCKELSSRKKLRIHFASEKIPKQLPEEISLCLFRVLQEALRNAAQYSGSQVFEVVLKRVSNELHLTVRDSGVGFDPADTLKGRGLGLMIMKERLRLVEGELCVESQREQGTIIHARVPLPPGMHSAVVAA